MCGVLLGLSFWARNDAIWLCFAVGVGHLLGWLPSSSRPLAVRVVELSLAAMVTVLVALPWLAYNVTQFGHRVPSDDVLTGYGWLTHDGITPRTSSQDWLFVVGPAVPEPGTGVLVGLGLSALTRSRSRQLLGRTQA